MQGTGRIVGQVTEPHGGPNPSPWPFVRGEIYGEIGGPGRIEFITDEDGRFAVENAPVGRVTVGISYMATADMGGYHSREAHVVEGQETQVLFTPPPGTPDVPLEFVVGDGSEDHRLAGLGLRKSRPAKKDDSTSWEEPHLAIELLPPADVPAAIPPTVRCRLERPGATPCTIQGVPKGHYRLQATAWFVVYSTRSRTSPFSGGKLKSPARPPRPADPDPPQPSFAHRDDRAGRCKDQRVCGFPESKATSAIGKRLLRRLGLPLLAGRQVHGLGTRSRPWLGSGG